VRIDFGAKHHLGLCGNFPQKSKKRTTIIKDGSVAISRTCIDNEMQPHQIK
jgi:hypothetical protein